MVVGLILWLRSYLDTFAFDCVDILRVRWYFIRTFFFNLSMFISQILQFFGCFHSNWILYRFISQVMIDLSLPMVLDVFPSDIDHILLIQTTKNANFGFEYCRIPTVLLVKLLRIKIPDCWLMVFTKQVRELSLDFLDQPESTFLENFIFDQQASL